MSDQATPLRTSIQDRRPVEPPKFAKPKVSSHLRDGMNPHHLGKWLKLRAIKVNGYARRHGIVERIDRHQLFFLLCERDFECEACGCPFNLVIDHDLSLANGGANAIENLAVLCNPCNCSKRGRTADQWSNGGQSYGVPWAPKGYMRWQGDPRYLCPNY